MQARIDTDLGLRLLEDREFDISGNSAEELFQLLKKALEQKLLNAATRIAVALIRSNAHTAEHLLYVLAQVTSMNSLRIINEARAKVDLRLGS